MVSALTPSECLSGSSQVTRRPVSLIHPPPRHRLSVTQSSTPHAVSDQTAVSPRRCIGRCTIVDVAVRQGGVERSRSKRSRWRRRRTRRRSRAEGRQCDGGCTVTELPLRPERAGTKRSQRRRWEVGDDSDDVCVCVCVRTVEVKAELGPGGGVAGRDGRDRRRDDTAEGAEWERHEGGTRQLLHLSVSASAPLTHTSPIPLSRRRCPCACPMPQLLTGLSAHTAPLDYRSPRRCVAVWWCGCHLCEPMAVRCSAVSLLPLCWWSDGGSLSSPAGRSALSPSGDVRLR